MTCIFIFWFNSSSHIHEGSMILTDGRLFNSDVAEPLCLHCCFGIPPFTPLPLPHHHTQSPSQMLRLLRQISFTKGFNDLPHHCQAKKLKIPTQTKFSQSLNYRRKLPTAFWNLPQRSNYKTPPTTDVELQIYDEFFWRL